MSFSKRNAMTLVLVMCLGICDLPGDGMAQEALELPDSVEPIIELKDDSRAAEKIQEVLKGGRPIQATGDGVLDGAIQAIHEQGSILDGSSLDPNADAWHVDGSHPPRNTNQTTDRQRVRVAELLLKSARLLEQVEPVDKTRQELVNKMRRETVRLLSK